MQEFSTVSASSYDPAALAAKLTEKSAEGWTVVSIVPTGGDVTAFLSRDGGTMAASHEAVTAVAAVEEAAVEEAAHVEPVAEEPAPAEAAPVEPTVVVPVLPEATRPEPTPVVEPAGWAVAPEPAAPAPMAPIVEAAPEPTPSYQPAATYEPAATYQPAATYEPAPTYQPAPAQPAPAQVAPAVPAGWYADPAGRFELRYWDGSAWTEHVSRAGQQFTDPPVA
jgi:hypothetical protein